MSHNPHDQNMLLVNFEALIEQNFKEYAKYIIQERALADVRDGLKPVQRRILFAMLQLRLVHDKPFKKSATTVGEVIGNYHPHGDSSIYEALVRMSQTWKNNLPLIEMHGNNGSIDGDNAAAMRYTECRLNFINQTWIDLINQNTVTWNSNFDGTKQEPSFLPMTLPILLINGSNGVAAGYASNIPPHNPHEVIQALIHLIDHPDSDLKQLMRFIKGPDFPTFGIIEGQAGITAAYTTGKGKIIIKGEMIAEESQNLKRLRIKSIPFETSKATILKQIDELRISKEIPGIHNIIDESDLNGINILLELNHDTNLTKIQQFLYKYTDLMVSFHINNVVINQKRPECLGLIPLLQAFKTHFFNIHNQAFTNEQQQLQQEILIIEGMVKAFTILDEIISLIKRSTSKATAIDNLVQKYQFHPLQATAIAELQLYKLTKTDVHTYQSKLVTLTARSQALQQLLADPQCFAVRMKAELSNLDQKLSFPRRSQLIDEISKLDVHESELVAIKPVNLLLTHDNYIKLVRQPENNIVDLNSLILTLDDHYLLNCACYSNDLLLVITNLGGYGLISLQKINESKTRAHLEHLNLYFNFNAKERVISALVVHITDLLNEGLFLTLISRNNKLKTLALKQLTLNKQKKFSLIAKLNDGDQLVSACLHHHSAQLLILTADGFGTKMIANQTSVMGKNAVGNQAVKMKKQTPISLSCVFAVTNQSILYAFSPLGNEQLDHHKILPQPQPSSLKPLASLPQNFTKFVKVEPHEQQWVLSQTNQWQFCTTPPPIAQLQTWKTIVNFQNLRQHNNN